MRKSIIDRNKDLTENTLLEYLSSDFWILNRSLVRKLGILPALWITHLIDKYQYFKKKDMLDKEGYFYNIQHYIEADTTLNSYQQTKIISELKEKGIISTKRRGLPARNYYKINIYNLINFVKNEETCSLKIKGQGEENLGDKINTKGNQTKEDNSLDKELSNDPAGQSDTPILPKKRKDLDISIGEETKRNRPTKESIASPRRQGKYLPYGDASEGACQLVNHWNGLKNTVTHRPESKAVERVLWWLANGADRGVDFAEVMDNFDAMLSDPQAYEVPRRKVGLDEFFFGNDFVKDGKRSWCSKLMSPGGCKQFLKTEDRNSEITAELREQYEKHVLVESPDYGPKQEMDFVKGASMLERYMRGRRLSKYIDEPKMYDYVNFMLKALADEFGASEITTGHLRSDYTFNSVLPRFLSRHFEE